MAKFQSTYSDEQRFAVLRAVKDQRMSHRAASVAAQAGQLGLPAFRVAASTVSHWVQQEAQREADADAGRVSPGSVAKTAALILTEQAYVIGRASKRNREMARRGKPDVDEAARIARATRDLVAATRALEPGKTPRSNGGKQDTPALDKPEGKAAPGLLDRLTAAERRAAAPGPANA